MQNIEFSICRATPDDAPLIARGIATALHLGEADAAIPTSAEEMEVWNDIFTQYSYRNTFKAIDKGGNVLGIIISYDGAELHKLREAFFAKVEEVTGHPHEPFADETDDTEWYIDSFAVWPEYRGHGIGRALLKAAKEEAHKAGKPAGLLVDKGNEKARRLYERAGFEYAGDRLFIDVMMDHLQSS